MKNKHLKFENETESDSEEEKKVSTPAINQKMVAKMKQQIEDEDYEHYGISSGGLGALFNQKNGNSPKISKKQEENSVQVSQKLKQQIG